MIGLSLALTESEKANILLETFKSVFRLPGETRVNPRITKASQALNAPELIPKEKQVITELSTLNKFRDAGPDGM